MATDEKTTSAGYVDIYLLPVPEQRMDEYREQASAFGAIAKEHGALRYREFRGDDLGDFLSPPDGTLQTAAVAEFSSRAHRDEVMEKVMADPRVKEMTEGEEIADMSGMRFGGFETLVEG